MSFHCTIFTPILRDVVVVVVAAANNKTAHTSHAERAQHVAAIIVIGCAGARVRSSRILRATHTRYQVVFHKQFPLARDSALSLRDTGRKCVAHA